MSIYEKLVSGYPIGDVTPWDFIDHLSIMCLFFAVRGLVQYAKLPEKKLTVE